MRRYCLTALAALILGGAPAMADVWDAQTDNDNGTGSDNELVHGAVQIHDLAGTADLDYYVIGQKPFSSYEVVADGGSGDFGAFGPTLERMQPDGTTVIQSSQAVSPGRDYARSLRWANTNNFAVQDQNVRVLSSSCAGGPCDGNDQYHIRMFETTTSIARFNNSGTQTTVLIVQNPTDYAVSGVVYYWGATGTLITSSPLSVAAKAIAVVATNTAAPGASGSITIAHNARYGDLKGKAVALEPSTGFSFDSLMESRPK
jgi:hypothetical protein